MSWDWSDLSDLLNDGGDVSDVDWEQMPEYSGAGEGIFGLETDNELAIPWTDDGSSWDSDGGFGGGLLGTAGKFIAGNAGGILSSSGGAAAGAYGANQQNKQANKQYALTQQQLADQNKIFGQRRAESLKYDAPRTFTQLRTAVANPSAYDAPNFSKQLQSDFDTATAGLQSDLGDGQTIAWGGGKITNTGGGALSFLNPEGNRTAINAGMNPQTLARSNPNIERQWLSQYGSAGKPKGAATFFMNNQLPQYAEGGSVNAPSILGFIKYLVNSNQLPSEVLAAKRAARQAEVDKATNRLNEKIDAAAGVTPLAHGGSTRYVRGGAPGQADDVEARLSPGEYVWDADVVAALGDGNNEAGAAALDKAREAIRKHKRSAPATAIPPKAKSPLAYIKGAK